jgi:hypothetical protein
MRLAQERCGEIMSRAAMFYDVKNDELILKDGIVEREAETRKV